MPQSLALLFRREEESWNAFLKRVSETEGEELIVLSSSEASALTHAEHGRHFLAECAKLRHRVRFAMRRRSAASAARGMGIRVYDKTSLLQEALAGHSQAEEALRIFSPQLWRQKWRSRLQTMGLLSLPKVRITVLVLLSILLFLFVVFRLLPSADVRISPRNDVARQTMNFLLVQSGAEVHLPSHVRTQPLLPIVVRVKGSVTSNQIGKQFTGSSAVVPMKIFNKTLEQVSFKKGTRLKNQAGMIFLIQASVIVPPEGSMTVRAKAETTDTYGDIIGERGNVPAGVHWDFPALSEDDQNRFYAENPVPAIGGTTSFRSVLQKEDLDIAQLRLQQQLLADAHSQIEQQVQAANAQAGRALRLLSNDQLVKAVFTGVVLPTHLIGQPVTSIAVDGTLIFKMFAYDAQPILTIVGEELRSHITEGKQIISSSVDLQNLDVRVFDYADDLSWIKATVELNAMEAFVLDSLTPEGASFSRDIRQKIAGISKEDALRIIKNLPEVNKVEIRLWPPWGRVLPSIPSNISISAP